MFLVAFAYIAVAIVVFFGVMAALLKFWPKSFDQLCDFLFPEPAEPEQPSTDELRVLDEPWEDHPDYRADIAKTNRQKHGAEQMKRIWDDATGGAA